MFPLSSLGISQSLISDVSNPQNNSITDLELREKAKLITEEILKLRPELYPSKYGTDPGINDQRLSIKRQILRRFDDQVSQRSVLDLWKKPVDVDFEAAGPLDNSDLEQLWDFNKRPENLKKQDYQDARETIERNRLENMFSEMQEDPSFDQKLKDYFAQKHRLKVQNYYEHSMKQVLKQGEPLDRFSDGFVQNELMDFLMKYSDLKLGEESNVYFGLAANQANSQDAISRFEEKTKMLQGELDKIGQAKNLKENYQKLINFERRFEELKQEAHALKNIDTENQIESTNSPLHDIKDLETRMNDLKDGGELGGFHQIYYDFNEYSTRIPFAMEWLDIRYDAREWVSRRIEEHVDRVIQGRMSVEKYSSAEELRKIDEDIHKGLDIVNIRRAVFRALEQELAIANEIQRNYLKDKDFGRQMHIDSSKNNDLQKVFDRQVQESPAKDRLAAFEQIMSTASEKYLVKLKKDKLDEMHYTFEFLLDEAMGKDYSYLLHQGLKDRPIRHGHDQYMEKEGFRSNRQVNNHFTARMLNKTVFEESSSSTHYRGAGDTSLGQDGLLSPLVFDNNHFKFEQYMQLDEPNSDRSVLKGYTQAFADADTQNSVSKSLGWYFKTLNRKINDSGL